MPDLVSPLLPDLTHDADTKKAAKKAAMYAITYTAGVGVAYFFPKTTGKVVGLATGLEVVPGKGFKLKPSALPVLMLPQPVGAAPPRLFGLPEIIGDPLEVAKILRGPNGIDELNRRIDADYAKQHRDELARFEATVKQLDNYDLLLLAAAQRQTETGSLERQEFRAATIREGQRRGIIDIAPLNNPGVRRGPSGISFRVLPSGAIDTAYVPPELPRGGIRDEPTSHEVSTEPDPLHIRDLEGFFARNPPDP